tara:strand:+ start:413 stop:607 length:195 start_codon:yes stop_codon:yes gene_type:complete
MLKNEININIEKIIICELVIKTELISLTGRKPPEEIKVIARFKELKDLIPNKFKIIKIKIVRHE